jgi:hypothetical protein
MEFRAMPLPHEHAIFQRLEATKQHGLASEFLLSWTGRADQHKPKVTVWPNDASTEQVVRDYLAKLLRGIVPDNRIIVARN